MSHPCVKTLNIDKTTIKAAAIDCSEKMTHSTTEQVAAQAWTSTFRAPPVTNPQTIKPSLVDQFYAKFNQEHAFSSVPTNPFKFGIFQNVTRSCLSINLTPTITISLTSSVAHFTQSYAQNTQKCQTHNLLSTSNAPSNKSLSQISFQVEELSIPVPNDTQMSTDASFQNILSSAPALRYSDQDHNRIDRNHTPTLSLVRPSICKTVQPAYQSKHVNFSISLSSQLTLPSSTDTHKDIQSLSHIIQNQAPCISKCLSKNKLEHIGHHSWLSTMYALTIRQIPAVNAFQDIQSLSRIDEIRTCLINYKSASDYIFELIRTYINQERSHTSRISQVVQYSTLSIRAEFFQNNSDCITNIALNQIGISINQASFPTLNFSQLMQFAFRCIQSYTFDDMLCIDSAFHSNHILPPQLSITYSLLIYTIEYPSYNSNLLEDRSFNSAPRLLLEDSASTYSNSESIIKDLTSEPHMTYTHISMTDSSIPKLLVQNPAPEPRVPRICIPNTKLPKLISLLNHGSDTPIISTTLESAYGEFI